MKLIYYNGYSNLTYTNYTSEREYKMRAHPRNKFLKHIAENPHIHTLICTIFPLFSMSLGTIVYPAHRPQHESKARQVKFKPDTSFDGGIISFTRFTLQQIMTVLDQYTTPC